MTLAGGVGIESVEPTTKPDDRLLIDRRESSNVVWISADSLDASSFTVRSLTWYYYTVIRALMVLSSSVLWYSMVLMALPAVT